MIIVNFLRNLDKNQDGLTMAEMMMVAAVVAIPLIIVATNFGGSIIENLKGMFDESKSCGKTLAGSWDGGDGNCSS